MKKLFLLSIYLFLCGLLLFGCGASKKVERIETDTTIDLSGRWNDTDSRLVSQAMINDCLNHPWIIEHISANAGKKPTVIVGSMRNRSSEHIAMRTFVNDIER
ncbi:penicillin-binding protein activator LpoB, partial [Candidatus Poribacteria bacterium]|nr:penicillin-binding protein activator LpoB [Candidatus Poribacteria bacterium]